MKIISCSSSFSSIFDPRFNGMKWKPVRNPYHILPFPKVSSCIIVFLLLSMWLLVRLCLSMWLLVRLLLHLWLSSIWLLVRLLLCLSMSIIFNALAMNNIWVLLSNFLLLILFVVVHHSFNVSVLKILFDLSAVIIKCVSCYDPC